MLVFKEIYIYSYTQDSQLACELITLENSWCCVLTQNTVNKSMLKRFQISLLDKYSYESKLVKVIRYVAEANMHAIQAITCPLVHHTSAGLQ